MASKSHALLREQTMSSQEEEAVTVNTRALIDKVLARYSSEWTTLRELLQNAVDARATKVTITFETTPSATVALPHGGEPDRLKHVLLHHTIKTLVVANDGDVFSENDWQRLKRIAEGNPDPTKIGAYGVGFYSVFSECDNPFVISGRESMGFFWRKDTLLTRRGKVQEDQATRGTTFLLDYRNQTNSVPHLLGLCQFLATSLTFVGLECVELCLDEWKIFTLIKKMTPPLVMPPGEINSTTRRGLMKVAGVEYQNAQVDALWMNLVGWNKTFQPSGPSTESQNETSSGSLRGWFARLASGVTSTSSAAQKAKREAEALQQSLAEDLGGFSTATVFLRISTVNIQTFVGKQLSQEMERATKKRPPSKTHIAVLTSFGDETSASLSTSAGAGSSMTTDIFGSVLPTKSGKIFIGFPTSQTTGLLAHLSIPAIIPTVERESIDLNARFVRDWNIELLRVAGIALRIAFKGEIAELKNQLAQNFARKGSHRITQEDLTDIMPRAIQSYRQYGHKESTPSMKVGEYIQEAFWLCDEQDSIDVLSSRGFLPSRQVRVATENLSFVDKIPVVPDELMDKASDFFNPLRDYGLLSSITAEDIKKALEAQALSEQQVIELVKWACLKLSKHELDAPSVKSLFDGTVAAVDAQYVRDSISPVIQLGQITSFVNMSKIPVDLPTPPTTLPFRLTSCLSPPQLQAIGWEQLQVVPWLRWIVETNAREFGHGQSLTNSPQVAVQVLGVLSKSWDGLNASSRETVVELIRPLTVIPTKIGMRTPPQSYFAHVKVFDDLPTATGLERIKDKFLSALGVRKTVELNVVFDRLMVTSTVGSASHVQLIRYFVSVKDDIPNEDLKKLYDTPFCVAEGGPTDGGAPRLWRVCELFEPNDAIRNLSLPVLQWPGIYRSSSSEGTLLKRLGLQSYPSVETLIGILATAQTGSARREAVFNYWITNDIANGYHQISIRDIKQAFLPLGAPGSNKIGKPSQCYANPKVSVLDFYILREDLRKHHHVFGVSMDPSIERCADRLVKKPPADAAQANILFGYFAGRLNEIGPDSKVAEWLGNAPIVPIAEPFKGAKALTASPRVRYASPRACFVGDGQSYGQIFDYVQFDDNANLFLLRVGSKHEPSITEIASMVVQQPGKFLDILGHEKYLQTLRKIADHQDAVRKDRDLWRQFKSAPCLLAEKSITQTSSAEKDLMTTDLDEEERTIKEYSLTTASNAVVLDDFATSRLFRSFLSACPQEDMIETLYISLGSPLLSRLIQDDQRVGPILRDQTPAQNLQKLVAERVRLFLHDQTKEGVRHDARWLEQNMVVKATEFIHVTRRLKIHPPQSVFEKKTAELRTESRSTAVLFVTAQYDLYEVSRAILPLLLNRPKQQDYLALETILESKLRRLKTKGYNVDRILRQKAAESRIAESQRQKREEEERQLNAAAAEAEAEAKAEAEATEEQGEKKGGTPTPERQITMPGSFEEPAPSTSSRKGGKRNLLGSLGQQLGFGQCDKNSRQGTRKTLTHAGTSDTGGPQPVDSSQSARDNLRSAVQACRPYGNATLFSPPTIKNVQDLPTYCDQTASNDLYQLGSLEPSKMKVFFSRNNGHADPRLFIPAHADALAEFARLLGTVCDVFELAPATLHIFHDEGGKTIAFNSQGSIFCNFAFFQQLHRGRVEAAAACDALAYWYVTVAHELAHNLAQDHGQRHSYFAESFVALYFHRVVALLARLEAGGA